MATPRPACPACQRPSVVSPDGWIPFHSDPRLVAVGATGRNALCPRSASYLRTGE